MKKLIKKLLAATLFLGVVGNSTAEEWKTYRFKFSNVKAEYSDDIIELKKGDKAEFINLVASSNDYFSGLVKYTLADIPSEISIGIGNSRVLQNFETFYGPCKLEIGARSQRNVTRVLQMTVKITRAHELKGNNLTGYSLVLPESTDTNYKLLLESSTDLVDWKADQTGSKAPSNRKRFYRLRAVKE
jgi:hypothetical protein